MIEKITKMLPVANIIALVVIALVLVGGSQSARLGAAGDINTIPVWFVQGLTAGNPKVTTVDSSGNIVAPITSSTGTYSGTLSVTGASTLGVTTVGTFTQGGGITSIATTSTTYTVTAAQFDTENVLDVTPGGASLTLTLPASSTLSAMIPTAGQTRTIFVRNATTTAGIVMTVAGGTGTILKVASSTPSSKDIIGDTDGDSYGTITFLRKTNTDIDALLTTFVD